MLIPSLRWKNRHNRPIAKKSGELPFREDLFSEEQLTHHARALAVGHKIDFEVTPNKLLYRLEENEDHLKDFNKQAREIIPRRRLTPASEWLLDNFYLIEEQIQLARRHLPRGYSRELPHLLSGPSLGYPRVYDIVLEFLRHVDAQLDSTLLASFVKAYQGVDSLKIGELWAIPIMLRLGLIENLRRIATRLAIAREHRNQAHLWVGRLQEMAEKNPSHLVIIVADMAKAELPLTSSFVAEFSQRLSQHSPVLHLARNWLEQVLVEQGTSIELLVHQDSQSQAADQVSVSHSIGSLRFLSAIDWKEFVESLSVIDVELRKDPAEVFSEMDFLTRDRYRHSVEQIARFGDLSEEEVAQAAIQLAKDGALLRGHTDRSAHVGFYLIDKGLPMLERFAHVRLPWKSSFAQRINDHPLAYYLGGIGLITSLATIGFVQFAKSFNTYEWVIVVLSLLFLIFASQMGVTLMNWLSTLIVKPHLLPRLQFLSGIPSDCRTIVAIPTMLTHPEGVAQLIETLEIHYLSNRDNELYFALLTDFRDDVEETSSSDAPLLKIAREGVAMLNLKYPSENGFRFLWFHRPRRWNPRQDTWMGFERKRGKLIDFNAYLRGGASDCFTDVVGDRSILSTVKYVITLDTDTQLPRDAAKQLVGTMAHHLNRPMFDPERNVVLEGYGILQPRIGISLPSSRHSLFVRLQAGDVGIDPYTREVSDLYQDLFEEGTFIGKGIYEVDAFQKVLDGRFPENTILSHDLIEACFARSGLVSDVQLYEHYPSRYNVDVNRRRRWIRGDWQIIQWLLPRVPSQDLSKGVNPLSILSRWKIFDNLRRSIVPISQLLFILATWLFASEMSSCGTALVILLVALPKLLEMILDVFRKSEEIQWKQHFESVVGTSGRQLAQISLTIAFLPYDAFICMKAIGTTLFRLLITHKKLLEWQTSSDAEQASRSDFSSYYGRMWFSPFLALVVITFQIVIGAHFHLLNSSILGAWAIAPLLAWWISLPCKQAAIDLSTDQIAFLRQTTRKTWRFFESFVIAEENWLPPDNYQETPVRVVATRTSPTNMGLALLANLAAYDFGYLSVGSMIGRTQATLATMQGLERHRGHFYNWYDTRTLLPLPPDYISSVDSGNLAGHLLVLGSGLREQMDFEILNSQLFSGLRDTLHILIETSPHNAALTLLDIDLTKVPTTLHEAYQLLDRVTQKATIIASTMMALGGEASAWANSLHRDCEDHLKDMLFLAPWLSMWADIPEALQKLLDQKFTLRDLSKFQKRISPYIDLSLFVLPPHATIKNHQDLEALSSCVTNGAENATQRLILIEALADQSDKLAAMDFTFLFDSARDLFSVGFNVRENRLDNSFYDLLASEARLCSYVAIALGQIPQDHWFSLGRLLITLRGDRLLASWSGSMFEYLMPLLVMPNYENTLLDHTCRAAVRQQIEYGKSRNVPWGISESGNSRTDAEFNYQYYAFGVPGLSLKRGQADELVIAPYASVMALMISPKVACENLQKLALEGRSGEYGFYEAVDYTTARLPPAQASVTVRSFMAHHQGMSFLALDYLLRNSPMQRRFMACPLLRATDLLLQERVPQTASSVDADALSSEISKIISDDGGCKMQVFTNPSPASPDVHLLSNGNYHVVISSSGGGYSRWRDLAVTRWREDATRDCWGMFIYLQDLKSGETWSVAHQPMLKKTKGYEAIFTQSRVEFRHHYAGLEVHTEISVSPEDDVELRRVTLSNRSEKDRVIELTTYAEVVLAPLAADEAHPAFSNLFVQSESLLDSSAVLCSRRARSEDENPPWLLHLMVSDEGRQGDLSCETDRAQFLGRGGTFLHPAAMAHKSPLSNTVGSVLDPIVSLRRTVTVPARSSVVVTAILGVVESRDNAFALVEKYQNLQMGKRAFDLAWTHNQVTLHQLNVSESEAQLYGNLAGALIYSNPARRADGGILLSNRRGHNGLWSYGISGDTPIVILRISDIQKIDLVRQLIQAHTYWRVKGLMVDLVILHEDVSIYRNSLESRIVDLVASGLEARMVDKPGGIFVRSLEQIPNEDRLLLLASARIVLTDEKGTLADQLEHRGISETIIPALKISRIIEGEQDVALPTRELLFPNGLGGFTKDGHEYVITLGRGMTTPAPWVNVLANRDFGTVVSESGSAYTWAENAHEFRLTPWNNDPIQDTSGEAFYIRDEESGRYWSPTPLPAKGATPYVIRHGFGYSVFEHTEDGIHSEFWVYVAMDASVKFSVLRLRNDSGIPRRMSVTNYCEWVLGDVRHKSLLHVQTEVDLKTGALLARNYSNTEFTGRIAFLDVNDSTRTVTGDRKEFIGRNGNLSAPAALKRVRLSGRVGAGLDPCGAIQVPFNLEHGQEKETCFRLGVGKNIREVQDLVRRFRQTDASRNALHGVWGYWNRTLGTVNVDTPDPAVNVMANGWLLYQTLSCRLWGRTGFYQSGGAYGFRDQLQDVMALVHAEPAFTREHILRAAGRQFLEGDVQHWWHPPTGRGVRTHFSDDFLWLPYVTCRYVTCVGDTGVLDEMIPFLDARPVKQEEEAYYDLPIRTEESATLYDHCVRAIENGLKFGKNGLPLIGCGDWNDGMNQIGKEGRGESVWLAFFMYDVLMKFSDLASKRSDASFADHCLVQARQLQKNIEENAWDGEWYRRAYFDNGEPLGSKTNPECQIDSLPQSWAILSGAGNPERAEQALESANLRLVRRSDQLVQLFDPPFDKSSLNPGYIKAYIPGVRENGGQYTHGAIWMAMAFAKMGNHDRAWELFNILNPVHHGATAEKIAVYKVEPYVIAADVYAVAPHIGRGGWTWYTGSSGWMYRLLVETLLGVNLEGDQLRITPILPESWPSFKVHYRYRNTVYHISISRCAKEANQFHSILLDHSVVLGESIQLCDDQHEHYVEIKIP